MGDGQPDVVTRRVGLGQIPCGKRLVGQADLDGSGVSDGVPGVHAEVRQDLVELGGIELHGPQVGSPLHLQLDVFLDESAE